MPTIIPFHRAVLADPAFTSEPFAIHTRWIETEWTGSVEPYDAAGAARRSRADVGARERITVEVGGRRLEVSLPGGLGRRRPHGDAAYPAVLAPRHLVERGGLR